MTNGAPGNQDEERRNDDDNNVQPQCRRQHESSLFASTPPSEEETEVYKDCLEHPAPVSTFNDDLLIAQLQALTTMPPEGLQPEQQEPQATTTSNYYVIMGSVANLCSATLGAGILSLPYAFLQSGLVGGFVLLAIAAWTSIISIQFLVRACEDYQKHTYESLVHCVLGPTAKRIVEWTMILFCIGCAVAYVKAVGDILERLLPTINPTLLLTSAWAMAMLPLSLLRQMSSLQWASGIGVASIVTLVVAVLVHFWEDDASMIQNNNNDTTLSSSMLWPTEPHHAISLLRAFPMIMFAFSCQVNVCAIHYELPSSSSSVVHHNNKEKVMHKVTLTSVIGCALLYAIISTVALLDFGVHVQPNILTNYCPRGIMHVAFGCMALAVVVAFPLNVFPARVALYSMICYSKQQQHNSTTNTELEVPLLEQKQQLHLEEEEEQLQAFPNNSLEECSYEPPETPSLVSSEEEQVDEIQVASSMSLTQHLVLSLTISAVALGLALVVPNISVVFGVLGGTTSSALGLVIPGLLGLRLCRRRRQQEDDDSDLFQQKVQAWILVVGGTCVGVLTTAVTIYSMIQNNTVAPMDDPCLAYTNTTTNNGTTFQHFWNAIGME